MTPIKVLLVDDEHEFTSILSKVLRRRGFEVGIAFNGDMAMAELSCQWFDVVLLDIKMPGQDGINTLAQIKSKRPSPEVILLTGHASVSGESDGLRTGAFAYLHKPHPTRDIISCIESAAARGRQTRNAGETS